MSKTNYREKTTRPVCVLGRRPAHVFPALCLLYARPSLSPQKLSYFSPLTWRKTKQKSTRRTAAVRPQQPIPASVPGACSKVKVLRHPRSPPRHRCSCGINHARRLPLSAHGLASTPIRAAKEKGDRKRVPRTWRMKPHFQPSQMAHLPLIVEIRLCCLQLFAS